MATASSPTSRPPQRTMSTHSIELVSGTHQFTIASYSLQKRIGPENFIRSGAFEVGGYSWTVRCYPVGDEEDKEHVSLFLDLMTIAIETVRVQYGFEINGPAGRFDGPRASNDFTPQNKSWGYRKFINIESVESQYLMNDCLTIACTVEVQKKSKTGVTGSRFIDVPPSRVLQDLAQLLESKHGSDVTFQVGPNDYAAHMTVLAMRSPVFKAQFFGPLAEDNTGSGGDADGHVVRIEEMEPTAFEAVLHFIYTDSLPPVQDDESQIKVVGEWLAAADRYGLERMRLLCENVLCENIDVENAAATLVLADRHHCPQLKAFCVDYIASPGLLRAVLATEGYDVLKLSCPSLLAEIVEKIARRCC